VLRVLAVAAAFALLGAACSGASDRAVDSGNGHRATPHATPTAAPQSPPRSIVQLGDSIASGEGTLYGYTYDPHSGEWTGGNIDAPWPPPYPLCHDSPDAYGNVVAKAFGATFTQFACTGAQFANGISTTQVDSGTTLRPAQFGNWSTQSNLNAAYDAAKPDLVLVTLGADDLQFVSIVEACIENGYEYYYDLAKLQCTASNPGSTIQSDYFAFLPMLKQNYGTLVSWIEARAKANNVAVPKIVFTNYADPLPPNGQKCPDTSWLYPAQTRYLSGLVTQLDQTITSTINGLNDPNVAVADISQAYSPQGVSHIWCTDAPWAYGLSIYHVYDPDSFDSQAPFHPTPDGQNSIAASVIAAARQFFTAPPGTPTTHS
jgi:lysophospholipase L1-like esterase